MADRVLITGGAGCIGSDLAERLVDRGEAVVVLDNLSSGRIEHVEPLMARPNFRFIQGSVLDRAALDAALQGVDLVFHLAANSDVKYADGSPTDTDLRQNTLGTYQLLEAMRRRGVKRLAFSSTSSVYGPCDRLPIAEDRPLRPISLYAASKAACEALISAFQNLFGMQCWIFRFANIVGPKVRKRGSTVVGDFIHKLRAQPRRLEILGDGRQAKSYLHNCECIGAMLFAVQRAHAPFNVFNVGCNDWLTVTRIADLVVEAMELSDVEFQYTGTDAGWPGDVPRFLLDVTALGRLGWTAKHRSEDAIRLAIQATLERLRSDAVAGCEVAPRGSAALPNRWEEP